MVLRSPVSAFALFVPGSMWSPELILMEATNSPIVFYTPDYHSSSFISDLSDTIVSNLRPSNRDSLFGMKTGHYIIVRSIPYEFCQYLAIRKHPTETGIIAAIEAGISRDCARLPQDILDSFLICDLQLMYDR